ncbi:MAG: MBL fold metallo-hydrolase [Chloroflexi bacterium]|nr:MBL fold metallo-hydrolase [Chloroflexota bacterium]
MRHFVPTIGLRIQSKQTGRVIAYSCDTEPCPATVRLAHRADVLLHDSTGASLGHSSAAQAGGIARDAEAAALYLIHYKPEEQGRLEAEARQNFTGPVRLAEDLMEIAL